MFASEKLRYEGAASKEEKKKIEQNLEIIRRTVELRLARKKLAARTTAEGVGKLALNW
jgi:hypothetical protein